jgi:DNA-binding GntR family transcriptional regulator
MGWGAAMTAAEWVRPRKIADEVLDSLRTMILTGTLPAGVRTTQAELARMLGVSTMPVREALLRLSSEGFVEMVPNKSFTVVRTSRQDIHDIYAVHAVLAGELTRRACRNATAELIGELTQVALECSHAVTHHDEQGSGRANWSFHRLINEAAQAPKLALLLRSTVRFIPNSFYSLVPAWAEVSELGHRQILAAFAGSEADAACEAAHEHVLEAGKLLISSFSSSGYWTVPSGTAGREELAAEIGFRARESLATT